MSIDFKGKLEYDEYVTLLKKMIDCSYHLQNKPPEHIPKESLIATIVQEELKDSVNDKISIQWHEFVPGRPNLVIKYLNQTSEYLEKKKAGNPKSLGFIGSHMDVVPANPEEWTVDPFKLTVDENDKDVLWGRGTTDCLGHVALLTLMLKHLAINDVKLGYDLGIVFIADEEVGNNPKIGVANLAAQNELEFLKHGPVYWVDSSDSQPCVGSGAALVWEFVTFGKKGHSGMPFNSINPILLGMEGVQSLIKCFSEKFPKHPSEEEYRYKCSSTMKPTIVEHTGIALNQIPSQYVVKGDIRLTPFYNIEEVKETLSKHVETMNQNIELFPKLHDTFNNVLDDEEKSRGRFEIKFTDSPYPAVACDMKSNGFKLLAEATERELGVLDINSTTGSLPLIGDLKNQGFDMQIIGYGVGKVYHAVNEYCTFSGMMNGYNIMMDIIGSH